MTTPPAKKKGRPRKIRTPQPEIDEIEDMDDMPATTGRPARSTIDMNLSLIQAELLKTRDGKKLTLKEQVNAALDIIFPGDRNPPPSAREAIRQWLMCPTRSAFPTRERLLPAPRVSPKASD